MKTLRELPLWFLVALLFGLAGLAGGVWLFADGLRARPPIVARPPDLGPSFPGPTGPAGPPEPEVTYVPPAVSGRPRSTPTRPAPSNVAIPTPYRSASPSAAPLSPSPTGSSTGSPSVGPLPGPLGRLSTTPAVS